MSGPPLEWPEEDQHLIPIERRRFGPHFEKPCANPDTIVCALSRCQAVYKCQWRDGRQRPSHILQGTILYELRDGVYDMNKNLMEWWHSHRMDDGKAYPKLVLMFLALDADKSGHGTTSRRRLARDSNLPESNVIDCLIDLQSQKLITADIDERGAINYRLNLKKWGVRRK